ncbi:MAG: MFS transporter [Halolamina sp.]
MSLGRRLFGDDAEVTGDRSFQLLLLASVCSPLGESVVSPVLDGLAAPYGVGDARIGLVMAAYTAPAVVLIPVAGALSDRVGRKPVLASGLALVGAAGAVLPLTSDFRVVLALRGLQGVGYTGIGPILVASLGDLYDGATEATAQGLRFTAVGVALTGLPLVAGALGAGDPQRALWLFAVALPVAAAIATLLVEPTAVRSAADADTDADADPEADADGSADPVDSEEPAADGGADADVGGVRGVARAVSQPGLAALLVGRGVPSFLWFAFLTYASVLVIRALSGSTGTAGALVAAASVASAAGTTQVGRVTARTDSRAGPMLGSLLVACVGLAVVALAPALVVAGVGAVAFGAGFGVVLSLYRSTLTTRAPPAVRGGVVSLGESLGRLGSTAAPVVTGALIAALGGDAAAVRVTVLAAAGVAAVVGSASVAVAARSGVLAGADGPAAAN